MNHIELKKIQKNKNWNDFEWFIDGKKLFEYLNEKQVIELVATIEYVSDVTELFKENY